MASLEKEKKEAAEDKRDCADVDVEDRFVGAMLGLTCGDILGAPVEGYDARCVPGPSFPIVSSVLLPSFKTFHVHMFSFFTPWKPS